MPARVFRRDSRHSGRFSRTKSRLGPIRDRGSHRMCGIAGLFNLDLAPVAPESLRGIIQMLAHRGPDDAGLYCQNGVGLAHARLSIIDLGGGHQPMSNEDSTLWITFNGEIFNYVELREELLSRGHQFVTNSDTEVILHLYEEKGEDCVQYLNGQW